ncbi:hypothetical protein FBU59_001144 [Linderina macrospora]|uniref:Uncharacterized protein n=1 Tax=Linderina macrospora TaxID=4868 RepID=A0ACC1JEW4_9FUNG|nr:hypothetical protein FBU59_001144 [Linderina macrospora]
MSVLGQTLRSIVPRISTHGLRFASVLAPMMQSSTASSTAASTAADGATPEGFQTGYPELLADSMTPQVMDEIQYILKDAGSKEYKPPRTPAEETEELLRDLQSAVEVATGMVDSLSQTATAATATAVTDSEKLHVSRILSVKDEPVAGGKTIELEISPADLQRFLGASMPSGLGNTRRKSGPAGLGRSPVGLTNDRWFAGARGVKCTECRFASSCSRVVECSDASSWSLLDRRCLVGSEMEGAQGSRILDRIDDLRMLRWAVAVAGLLGLGTAVEWVTGRRMHELRGIPGLGKIPTTTLSNIMFCL